MLFNSPIKVQRPTKESGGAATPPDNGLLLRALIESSGLTQAQALAVFNHGQARPLKQRTLKSYLAAPTSASRIPCPDRVVAQMRNALSIFSKANNQQPEDLLPIACPFNCTGTLRSVPVEHHQWAVHCNDCGCSGPRADNELDAIRRWNLRR